MRFHTALGGSSGRWSLRVLLRSVVTEGLLLVVGSIGNQIGGWYKAGIHWARSSLGE